MHALFSSLLIVIIVFMVSMMTMIATYTYTAEEQLITSALNCTQGRMWDCGCQSWSVWLSGRTQTNAFSNLWMCWCNYWKWNHFWFFDNRGRIKSHSFAPCCCCCNYSSPSSIPNLNRIPSCCWVMQYFYSNWWTLVVGGMTYYCGMGYSSLSISNRGVIVK